MSNPVVLPERLDLSTVPDLTSTLLSLPAEGAVTLDASRVTHLGALGLQVLMSAAIRSNAADGSLAFSGVSERVLEHMAVMGSSPKQISETRR